MHPISTTGFDNTDDYYDKNMVLADEYSLEEDIISKFAYDALHRKVDMLQGQEKEIIVKYYGLQETKCQKIVGIARDLGISRDDCCRIKDKAIQKLRNIYASDIAVENE